MTEAPISAARCRSSRVRNNDAPPGLGSASASCPTPDSNAAYSNASIRAGVSPRSLPDSNRQTAPSARSAPGVLNPAISVLRAIDRTVVRYVRCAEANRRNANCVSNNGTTTSGTAHNPINDVPAASRTPLSPIAIPIRPITTSSSRSAAGKGMVQTARSPVRRRPGRRRHRRQHAEQHRDDQAGPRAARSSFQAGRPEMTAVKTTAAQPDRDDPPIGDHQVPRQSRDRSRHDPGQRREPGDRRQSARRPAGPPATGRAAWRTPRRHWWRSEPGSCCGRPGTAPSRRSRSAARR